MRSAPSRSAALLAVTLFAAPLAAQANWAAYEPGTFSRLIVDQREGIDTTPLNGASRTTLTAQDWPQRVTVRHTGERRPLSEASQQVLRQWAVSLVHDSTVLRHFANEYRFIEFGVEYWIPVQVSLEGSLAEEVKPGDRVTLLTRWLGSFQRTMKPQWVFIVNEFEDPPFDYPPSQWEVNGFLLGQHWSRVDSALGAPWRVIPGRGSVSNRIYVIDRERGSYMAFAVDSALRGIVTAVQVTGARGTAMRPFLGITLGSKGQDLLAKFGQPTSVDHQDDINADMLAWVGRNYTVEVDSTGIVSSIRISGYEGFKTDPDSTDVEPIARLEAAFRSRSMDSLLAAIAPDIEIFKGGKVVSFTKAPRAEIENARSPIRGLLKEVASRLRTRPTDSAIRMQEVGQSTILMTRVYKWQSGPISELVFHWYPGGWRLWEVRYR